MKTSKINVGLFILITLAAINGQVINVSAQQSTCNPGAPQSIYFTEPGYEDPPVTGVHPESKGYDLHIIGYQAFNWEVLKAKYMASVSRTKSGWNETRKTHFAIWHVDFAPNMAQVIPHIQIKNTCPPGPHSIVGTRSYNLDASVRLFNQ